MNLVQLESFGRRIRVVDPDSMPAPGYALGVFDDREPFIESWLRLAAPGQVLVDVGARFGLYTLPAIAYGAIVVAYEPSDDGWRILQANVMATMGNTAESIAVQLASPTEGLLLGGGPASGPAILRRAVLFDDAMPYPAELARQVFAQHYPTRALPLVTSLDRDLVARVNRVDAIKIDVEGAEYGVLAGAVGVLERDRPTLLIEDHEGISDDPACEVARYPERIQSGQRMRELLEPFGYRIHVAEWGAGRRFWWCEVQR